jgi:membrane-associated protein
VIFDAVGAVTWATVNSVIGYVGGKAFERQTWLAFVVSFAVAILVGAVVELVRRLVGRRHTDRSETEAAGPSPPGQEREPRSGS